MIGNVAEDPKFITCIITGDETLVYEIQNSQKALPAEAYKKSMENCIKSWLRSLFWRW